MMDSGSGHLYFDASCHGNMLLLGTGDPVLRGGSRSYLNIDQESSKRIPFFSSSDDLMDEEYYDEQMPEKKRRLTPQQVHLLEKSFEAENKLEPERKTQLAKKLGLQPRQVAVWFQNRRARWKTKQLERDYDNLKSSYDSLRSDHDSLLKDNEKLKSEVVTLTEKLQVAPMVGPVQKSEPLLSSDNEAAITPVQLNIKVEDRLSSGSGGSAVVDEDGLQLVDSGDSYFPNDDTYRHCEDDGGGGGGGSEDSRSCYFADVFATVAEHNQQGEAEPLGWWVWS